MERSLGFQSLPDSFVIIGQRVYPDGHERPDTYIHINVRTRFNCDGGEQKGTMLEENQIVDVSLSLTAPQIAKIVKDFFLVFLDDNKAVFGKMLRRLLQKRWALMTAPEYKDRRWSGEGYDYMQYTNL